MRRSESLRRGVSASSVLPRSPLDSAKAGGLSTRTFGAPPLTTYVVDFDSTLIRVEALDVLAEIALAGHGRAVEFMAEIARLTDQAMSGEIAFEEALARRIALIQPRRVDIARTVERLRGEITPSAGEHAAFFARPDVHVISGGFRDIVAPVSALLGVARDRVLANSLVFDEDGVARGYDAGNPLSRSGGKAQVVRGLASEGEVVAVGDGWTDYEIRAAGAAHRFYAFIENVERPRVVAHADRVARSFGDLLRQEGL